MNYKRNKKYFTHSTALLQLGIACLFASIPFIFLSGVAGGLLMAFGILFMVLFFVKTPKDKDIDADLFGYFANANLKERALARLGIDESEITEIAPVYLDGYYFDSTAAVRVGKDGKARSSLGRAVYFFFTQNEVYCYTYTVSLIESMFSEDTDTYFYTDIVSVATTTGTGTITDKTGKKTKNYQYDSFKLTTSGGTYMEAGLRDKAGAERSIIGMRNLVKAKKQAR